MPSLSLRLGPKLNLSLLVFILLLGTATAILVLVGFNRSQDNAAEKSRLGLEREGRAHLLETAGQQSYIGALQLAPAADWGHQSGWFLALKGQTSEPIDPASLATAASGIRFDSSPFRTTDLIVPPGTAITPRVQKDITESAVLDGLFVSLFSDNEGSLIEDPFRPIAIFYVSVDGVTRYYPPTNSLIESTTSIADIANLHSQIGSAGNPSQQTVWTSPYDDEAQRGLVITVGATG